MPIISFWSLSQQSEGRSSPHFSWSALPSYLVSFYYLSLLHPPTNSRHLSMTSPGLAMMASFKLMWMVMRWAMLEKHKHNNKKNTGIHSFPTVNVPPMSRWKYPPIHRPSQSFRIHVPDLCDGRAFTRHETSILLHSISKNNNINSSNTVVSKKMTKPRARMTALEPTLTPKAFSTGTMYRNYVPRRTRYYRRV